ncbi:MAG TPA: serine/threonine-protein kinase [Polyangiaceae bacterium]
MSPADPFGLIGQLLDGQFKVDALVGEGGFSAVYRGTHVGLGEPIAIKCLKLSSALAQAMAVNEERASQGPATPVMNTVLVDSFVKRFRDEGRILYKLSQGNLNVVRCIASGTTLSPASGALVPYLVLEWLEGKSLQADLEARNAGRSLAETMELLEPAFDAITYAHAMGVVHRDLSTGNIFLAQQRDGAVRAKVLDFGVAKVMTDDLEIGPRTQTLAQIRIYSPAYAAPEQFDSALGPPGAYTDVYSLALVAVEVLTGRGVRNADTLGAIMQSALDPNAPRTPRSLGVNVPDAMEQVFARALSIDPKARQKDASELLRELRGAMRTQLPMDLGATARQPSPVGASGPPATQRMSREVSNPLGVLKATMRMPSAPPPPPNQNTTVPMPVVPPPPAAPAPAPAPLVPPAAPSASQLFQPPAVPPPPGAALPAASGSFAAFKTTERSAMEPAGMPHPSRQAPTVRANDPKLQQTANPLSAASARRAQWLVGLVVFIFVLAAGGVALRFWLLK